MPVKKRLHGERDGERWRATFGRIPFTLDLDAMQTPKNGSHQTRPPSQVDFLHYSM